ncbi:PREDICTED: immunoglobulin superfamily member 5 isoform X2 [Thamnophis sirtalis]|uniref:immunoglobulin superfamily member 5 isoform X2 n=1 Tax=Thamnophis sirtalis TaxID=35019 RepID=UPI0006B21865|nr:PREDICTED: immunoglobulin superfamily member 5 isoform X2 [Thamnophis sirtalis]
MDKLQGWTGLIITLMLYLTDPGFGYAIVEGPQNVTAVVGSVARFSCTVSDGWKILIWLFNGNPKLSVLSSGETIVTDERYTQNGSKTNGSMFTSELMIHNVQLTDSGQIKCSLQNNNNNRYAFLSVYKSNYQSELRKISGKKKKGGNLETVSPSGKENYGYSAEQMPHHTSFPVAEIVYDTKKDLNMSSSSEVSNNKFQAEEIPSRTNVYPINPVKIRNVTLI